MTYEKHVSPDSHIDRYAIVILLINNYKTTIPPIDQHIGKRDVKPSANFEGFPLNKAWI